MSLFNPLRLLSFFLIHGKILIQDIWRARTGWDEVISDELCARWQQWTSLLWCVDQIEIPRCYFPHQKFSEAISLQLHVFVDASEAAFATVPN